MAKSVTFQDIADYTGLTKTTVSRYFNHPDTVTPKNQKIIHDACDALGYKSNKVARILAKGETEFIGLIIPNLYLTYYAEILEKILRSYEKYGYKFLVFSGSSGDDHERQYIQELLAYHVEGLLILSHTIPSEELASFGLPVVSIEREDQHISSVNTDNYQGGVAAAELLRSAGCEVYLYLNAPQLGPAAPASQRFNGFSDVCGQYGLPFDRMTYTGSSGYGDLAEQVHVMMRSIDAAYPGKRKGIFCSNDVGACIVLNYLIRTHGGLPEDYRLVGFDGSTDAAQAAIPITTVAQQLDLIVDNAMELLDAQIQLRKADADAPLTPVHRLIPPVPTPRGTT